MQQFEICVDYFPDPEPETKQYLPKNSMCPACGGSGWRYCQLVYPLRRPEHVALRRGGTWIMLGCPLCGGTDRRQGNGLVTAPVRLRWLAIEQELERANPPPAPRPTQV